MNEFKNWFGKKCLRYGIAHKKAAGLHGKPAASASRLTGGEFTKNVSISR